MNHDISKNRVGGGFRRDVAVCLLLVVVILVVYLPVKGHEFVHYDDGLYILDNKYVRSGLSLENIKWAFTSTQAANWHPVTWLSHMLDCHLFGTSPGMHHVVSVLFHTLNCLLVYQLLNRMTGCWKKSAFVAALFAVHPLHVESVAWAAERKDVLCGFFWMLAMGGYLRYVQQPGLGRYAAVVFFFSLGLMSKPMIVTLPFVLLLLDFWPLGRLRFGRGQPIRRIMERVVEKLPLLLLSAGSCLVTYTIQQNAGAVGSWGIFPAAARLTNALAAYIFYLEKMFWPSGLAFFYPFPTTVPGFIVIGAIFILAAISCMAVMTMGRHPYFLFGWLWYLGTLVPVIGIVQMGLQAMADRYVYMPQLGIWVIIAWGGPVVVSRFIPKRAIYTMAVLLLIPLMAISRLQVHHWQNSATLFRRALDVTVGNYVAHNNLGRVYADEGKTAQAAEQFRMALKIRPDFAKTHYNLAVILDRQGQWGQAAGHFAEALRQDPEMALAHYGFGRLLENQGKTDAAAQRYRKALNLDANLAVADYQLGNIMAGRGRFAAAVIHYQRALRGDPRMVQARHNLGNALLRQGQVIAASAQYLSVLRTNPDNAAVHNNMGLAMIRLGRIDSAITHFNAALRLQPEDRQVLENLDKARALKEEVGQDRQ